MMNYGMMDGMMWGVGVMGFFAIAVTVLILAALVKYLFFR